LQQIPFIDLFKSTLHVSGDKLAHPQEHFLTVYTVSVILQPTGGRQQYRCIVPKAVHTNFNILLTVHINIFILTFERRVKSHLPSAGIIRSSPYSPR